MIGLDAGTSSVKGARFAADGTVLDRHIVPVPPVVRRGDEVTQDLQAILAAADAVLTALGPSPQGIAFTTQRDTLVIAGELISWMDTRAGNGSIWDLLPPTERAGSLVSALCEHWTGQPAETTGTVSRHLRDDPRCPTILAIGQAAGHRQGSPVYPTAGDKNCELLGNGAIEGRAGLSMGSAVSLGLTVDSGIPTPGVFAGPSARAGHVDLETGLVVGMSAWAPLGAWLPMDHVPGPWVDDIFWLPHFAGALDRPATPALIGGRPDTDPACLATAWAQGVVAELRRLRPPLEQAAQRPITAICMSGGGSSADGWARLVADAFSVPVTTSGDRYAGCRGAVNAVRIAQGASPLPMVPGSLFVPLHSDRFDRWYPRWLHYFEALNPR